MDIQWHRTNVRERHLKRRGQIVGKLARVSESEPWSAVDSITKKDLGTRLLECDAMKLVEKAVLTEEERQEMKMGRILERVLTLEKRVLELEKKAGKKS